MAVFVPVPSIRQAKSAFVPPQTGLLPQGPAIDYALCVLWEDYRVVAKPKAPIVVDWEKACKTPITATHTVRQTPQLLPQRVADKQLPPPPPSEDRNLERPAFDVDAVSSRLED